MRDSGSSSLPIDPPLQLQQLARRRRRRRLLFPVAEWRLSQRLNDVAMDGRRRLRQLTAACGLSLCVHTTD